MHPKTYTNTAEMYTHTQDSNREILKRTQHRHIWRLECMYQWHNGRDSRALGWREARLEEEWMWFQWGSSFISWSCCVPWERWWLWEPTEKMQRYRLNALDQWVTLGDLNKATGRHRLVYVLLWYCTVILQNCSGKRSIQETSRLFLNSACEFTMISTDALVKNYT